MYPSISHALYDIFGLNVKLPVQTFGFFVAMAFIFGALVLKFNFKERYERGLIPIVVTRLVKGKKLSIKEILPNVIFGFLLGYKLFYAFWHWTDFSNNPQELIISSEGDLLGGIIFAAFSYYILYRDRKKELEEYPEEKEVEVKQPPQDLVWEITFSCALAGFLGAKVFHFLEYPETLAELFTDPSSAIFSGLTFYGGLLFGMATALYYCKKLKMRLFDLLDIAAPSLMLSYGVGRLGCHFSGDGDWGIVNNMDKPTWFNFLPDWLWAFKYPHNVNGEGVLINNCDPFWGYHCFELQEAVFPTPLYEFLACLLIFLVLFLLRNTLLKTGLIFSLYFILNGLERFAIEKIRVNVVYEWGFIQPTQAEVISLFMIIIGIIGFIFFYKRKPN